MGRYREMQSDEAKGTRRTTEKWEMVKLARKQVCFFDFSAALVEMQIVMLIPKLNAN